MCLCHRLRGDGHRSQGARGSPAGVAHIHFPVSMSGDILGPSAMGRAHAQRQGFPWSKPPLAALALLRAPFEARWYHLVGAIGPRMGVLSNATFASGCLDHLGALVLCIRPVHHITMNSCGAEPETHPFPCAGSATGTLAEPLARFAGAAPGGGLSAETHSERRAGTAPPALGPRWTAAALRTSASGEGMGDIVMGRFVGWRGGGKGGNGVGFDLR